MVVVIKSLIGCEIFKFVTKIIVCILSISDSLISSSLELSNNRCLGGLEFSNEMLLEVRLHHCFGPFKSITDPGIDLVDVGIVDFLTCCNSCLCEFSHSFFSRGIVGLHGTFLLSDKIGKILSQLVASITNKSINSIESCSCGIFLIFCNSLSKFVSCISNYGVEFGDSCFKHISKLVSVRIVGVSFNSGEFVRDLSVSMWIWKSEVIKISNTSEIVSWSVERASSFSKTSLVYIVATSISEDMHGVDDILSN